MNKLNKQIRDTFTFAACKYAIVQSHEIMILCNKRKVIGNHLFFGKQYCYGCPYFECNDIDYWKEELQYE
jgi:hypothetical protein